MRQHKAFFLLMLIGLMVNAQTTINLHGKVSNQTGKPIANAVVLVLGQDLKDTTGPDGSFLITKGTVSVLPILKPQSKVVSLDKGFLELCLPEPSLVKIEIFDVKGNLLTKEVSENVLKGFYRFNFAQPSRAEMLLVIRVTIGRDEMTFRYLPLHNGNYLVNQPTAKRASIKENGLAKIAAVNDTLKITAPGYTAALKAITSYDQEINITLDSSVSNGKNPPCPSGGCGKELSDLKSGAYTITSAGLSRKYTIDIPAGYDKNKPYRLIFGMHCMGMHMDFVVSNKYYELKTYADKENVQCIYVAPEGYSDDSPWRISDNKDHIFFGDMLKLFKEKLCVDTSRIFCCGFSYGAMVSYSLSLDFAKQLRAVATYAPANWNIWLPTNTHDPIAYYQTTGTTDNLCTWVNSDAKKEGGKYCVLQHIEDNGCTAPATIPTATSSTHLSTEFSGCKDGYPVVFGSFQGGHANTAKDPGSSVNWIAKETWDFFMRF
jgi:poly(3-hydroxybutyrate) depolymerase